MSDNKIPTAKQIIDKNFWNGKYVEGDSLDVHEQLMIDFAKLHVQKALESANQNSQVRKISTCTGGYRYEACHKSILNAYPLENIK